MTNTAKRYFPAIPKTVDHFTANVKKNDTEIKNSDENEATNQVVQQEEETKNPSAKNEFINQDEMSEGASSNANVDYNNLSKTLETLALNDKAEQLKMQNTLDSLLKLTNEMHENMFQQKEQSSHVQKEKVQKVDPDIVHIENEDSDIQSSFALLYRAKSVSEILDNNLVKSVFKVKLDTNHEEEALFLNKENFNIPEEVSNNLANDNTLLPDVEDDMAEAQTDNGNTADDNEDGENGVTGGALYCLPCIVPPESNKKSCVAKCVHNGKFVIKDLNYTSKDNHQERWFLNFKHSVLRHLKKLRHHQNVAVYNVLNKYHRESSLQIEKLCSNILYYIIKTNSAWALYPVLLAVVYRSGCEVGNINHSRYACHIVCDLLDKKLKAETVKWFSEQKSVTITADLGTILGLSMLVVLLVSEHDKTVKFAGINLVNSKGGIYLANEIMKLLTSKDHLNLKPEEVKQKISGMAGDGAFCKENDPFKSTMKVIFGSDFIFRWDLLHLVNRAHIDAVANVISVDELLSFVQNHSSELRSGLDYTSMVIENIVGFRRPILKSTTRMVNYEYNQLLRFQQNSKYFDHPFHIIETTKYFLLISYVTKMVLQVAQSTTVTTKFVEDVFYDLQGKEIMNQVVEMISLLMKDKKVKEVVEKFKPKECREKEENSMNASKKSKKGNAPKQTKKNTTENVSQESQEDKHIS